MVLRDFTIQTGPTTGSQRREYIHLSDKARLHVGWRRITQKIDVGTRYVSEAGLGQVLTKDDVFGQPRAANCNNHRRLQCR